VKPDNSEDSIAVTKFVKKLIVTVAIITITAPFALTEASAQVTPLVDHGAVASGPESYGVYEGDLYFSSGDQLYHVDGGTEAVTQIPLPAGLGAGIDLDAEFAAFDGALMFHAWREFNDWRGRGRFLHRLVRNGSAWDIALIDIPEEPDEPQFNWGLPRGYPDATTAFATYRNQLYFFGSQLAPGASFTTSSAALYRLSSADADVERVRWNTNRRKIDGYDLDATEDGLAISARYIGEPRYGLPDRSAYTIIRDPSGATHYQGQLPEDYPSSGTSVLETKSVVFDGHVFFATANYDLVREPGEGVGPYADPGEDIVIFAGAPYQVELGRMAIATWKKDYFDLVPTTATEVDTSVYGVARTESSSSPANFVVSGNSLLFTAGTGQGEVALYVLPTGDATPTRTTIGQASSVRPIASVNGNTWFAAKVGQDLDLHRGQNGGGTFATTGLGESVAQTAMSFSAFGNATVFTARDDNGDWATYLYRNAKPQVDPPTQSGVGVEVTINNTDYPTRPGLVSQAGEKIVVRCSITNNTTAPITNVRLILDELRSPEPPRLASVCKIDAVDPGQTARCRLATKVKLEKRKYSCKARSRSIKNVRARAWVTGQQ